MRGFSVCQSLYKGADRKRMAIRRDWVSRFAGVTKNPYHDCELLYLISYIVAKRDPAKAGSLFAA